MSLKRELDESSALKLEHGYLLHTYITHIFAKYDTYVLAVTVPFVSPEALDHERLLLAAHADAEQGAEASEGALESTGVLHGAWADAVGLEQRRGHLGAQALVLAPQQAEDGLHQGRILHRRLLSPAQHGVGYHLPQGR